MIETIQNLRARTLAIPTLTSGVNQNRWVRTNYELSACSGFLDPEALVDLFWVQVPQLLRILTHIDSFCVVRE